MFKRFTILFTLLLSFQVTATMLPSLMASGKLVGKVIDADTKEPLIGANILIIGTSMGSASNIDGDFFILNVAPGTYSIRASYIGYNDVTYENVRVYGDLTTELNFELRISAFETEAVIVQSERPLINKNTTGTDNLIKAEDLANLPVRDVNSIVSLQAGIVQQDGNLYVRGSRSDAVAFYVDGVLVTNALFGGNNTSVINNAIEEIQVQSGGYTAEYGGATGGIVSTTIKTGSDVYNASIEVVTDNFVGKNSNREFLGGYSYGYSEYVATLSGPIIPNEKLLNFFIAGSRVFQRSPIRFWEGANFNQLSDPSRGALSDTINLVYPAGYRINQAQSNYRLQGNITADLNPILLKLGGTYFQYNNRDGVGIGEFFAQNRAGISEGYTATSSLKITHLLSERAFYDINFSWYSDYAVNMDPDFKHNIAAYGDSLENAKIGYTLQADGLNLSRLRAFGFSFAQPDEQQAIYQKIRQNSLGGNFNLLYQLGKEHELKTGGEFKYWTIRRYAFGSAFDFANFVRSNPDAVEEQWYRRVDNYGYDLGGNKFDGDGLYSPKHPIFGAYYIQDKMEFSDLVLNIGLRLDYIDSDSKVFKDANNIIFDENGIIVQDQLVEVDPITEISPRLGFAFNLTDITKFHAQYGKFIQQTRLRDIYQGWIVASDNIKGGFAIQTPVGFGLRPEKTTSYELGFTQQVGENFAFDLTAFYKDIKDQVQIRNVPASAGAQHGGYYVWTNGDFATTKGFEIRLDLRRIERLSASIDYTFSDASGTGSAASTGFRAIWQSPTTTPYQPLQVSPLDFNQTHRGSINLDYRFSANDEVSWLSNSGANLLFTFNSGHNFTKVEGYGNGRIPQESLNSSTTPWNFQLDARIDKSFSIGPFNANLYLWVINVLNIKNVQDVFIQTGTIDDGYLVSNEGSARIQAYRSLYGEEVAKDFIDTYNTITNDNADNFGTPRQIRLGFQLEY